MSTHPHINLTGAHVSIVELGNQQLEEVVEFLSADVVANLFMLSWVENYGICAPGRPDLFHLRGLYRDGRLCGIALVITDRLVLLQTLDDEAAARLGDWYRERGFVFEHIVSARRCVTPFWKAYSAGGHVTARLNRAQELYVLPRAHWRASHHCAPADVAGDVRVARPEDLDAVFLASARMHAEETLEDPLERDPSHFRRHVEHRIDNRRTYVWFDDRRRLVFKADISAQSPFGAQISGVYTPPALRGRGIATCGMFGICESLFDRGFPRVTLYVNRENEAARRVYHKVGFEYHAEYQTIFVLSEGARGL